MIEERCGFVALLLSRNQEIESSSDAGDQIDINDLRIDVLPYKMCC